MMRRNLVLAIDVEPDARRCRSSDSWTGIAITVGELEKLRLQFSHATGVPTQFHWFLRCDPQIAQTWGRGDWLARACPGFVEAMLKAGDGTGIHPHFWQWNERHRSWRNEFQDPSWWAHCLDVSVEGHRRLAGADPAASRCGDRFFANELVDLLVARGIRYDLTLEPGVPEGPVFDDSAATALLPDYREVPRVPYQPSPADYRRPSLDAAGQPHLWMLPLATTNPPRAGLVRHFPFIVRTSRTMNLVLRPGLLWRHLEQLLAQPAGPAPLVLVLRAGDLSSPSFLASFRKVTGKLAAHSGLARCRFVTVETAMADYVASLESRDAVEPGVAEPAVAEGKQPRHV
jgi:hypothetical protein